MWMRYVLFCIRALCRTNFREVYYIRSLFIRLSLIFSLLLKKKTSLLFIHSSDLCVSRCSHNFISLVVSILLLCTTVCTTKINLSFLIPCLPWPRAGLTKLVENIDENLPPNSSVEDSSNFDFQAESLQHNQEQCHVRTYGVVGATTKLQTRSIVN